MLSFFKVHLRKDLFFCDFSSKTNIFRNFCITNSDFALVLEGVGNPPTLTEITQSEVLGENLENRSSLTGSNLLHRILIASFYFICTVVSYKVLL